MSRLLQGKVSLIETFSTRVFALTVNLKRQFQVWRLTFMASTALATPLQQIEEAAILNFQTTVVFDFQMATRSPIFTHSLKNTSKLVLKRLVYITF